MKKLLVLVLVVAFCAVGFSALAEKTIAGVVFQEDQFMKTLADGYAAAAAELGYEILQANTNNDQSRESEIINTYISQGIDGIAIAPLSNTTSAATLQAAADAGLQVAVCNLVVDNFPFAVVSYSSDNHAFCYQTGEAAAAFIKENYPEGQKINIGLIQFKTQIPEQSADRVNGFIDALTDAGINFEIVADQDAWLQDMAVAKAGDMLTANPEIDIIFAANDGGTIGSTMAVENAGLEGKVFVFGTDASEQIAGLLKDEKNILQAVTGQDPYQIGYMTATACINAIEGKEVEGAGTTVIVPGMPLIRTDVEAIDAFLAGL